MRAHEKEYVAVGEYDGAEGVLLGRATVDRTVSISSDSNCLSVRKSSSGTVRIGCRSGQISLTLVTVGFERKRYTSSFALEDGRDLMSDVMVSTGSGFVNDAADGLV